MKFFIEKGFDGNIRNKNVSTALHYGKMTCFHHFYLLFLFFIASRNGHLDIVKYFIETGFDGFIQDKNGSTALQYGNITRFDYLPYYFFFL